MADCLKCAKCREVSDGAWVQCGDEGRQGEQIPWDRARQSPCDDFESKPAPAPVVDCRECAHCAALKDGEWVDCGLNPMGRGSIAWARALAAPCRPFQPKPAPASPPASADREGADWIEAARLVVARGHLDTCGRSVGPYPCSCGVEELDRAISSEEARRARPAVEDPRDALLRQCAADFARVRDYAPTLDRTPVDNSGCEDCARAREHAWPPSRLCETHYGKAAQQERANEQLLATQDYPMREIARKALEALRAAGVEPAPVQEGSVTT